MSSPVFNKNGSGPKSRQSEKENESPKKKQMKVMYSISNCLVTEMCYLNKLVLPRLEGRAQGEEGLEEKEADHCQPIWQFVSHVAFKLRMRLVMSRNSHEQTKFWTFLGKELEFDDHIWINLCSSWYKGRHRSEGRHLHLDEGGRINRGNNLP